MISSTTSSNSIDNINNTKTVVQACSVPTGSVSSITNSKTNNNTGHVGGDPLDDATPCVVSSNALIFAADFASSWTSYVLALLAAHPFDTLRVRCQTSNSRTIMSIIKADGARSLYAGILTPMFSNAPLVASIFAFNELFRGVFRYINVEILKKEELRQQKHFTHMELLLAGATAGVLATAVSTPATFIKVQQQIRGQQKSLVPAAHHVAKEIYLHNGFTGLYRALVLDATCSGIGRAVYFTGYEVLKSEIGMLFDKLFGPDLQKLQQKKDEWRNSSNSNNSNNNQNSSSSSVVPSYTRRELGRNVLAAAATASLGWICVYPLEVCKVRIQADSINPASRKYLTLSSVWLDVYRTLGVRGFFRGFPLTMMKSWISSGLALPLYEYLKPQFRSFVPRCPEDPTPKDKFGKPSTYIKDLFAEDSF